MNRKVLAILCAAAVCATSFAGITETASAASHKHSYKCITVRTVLCDVNGINRYTCSCGDWYTEKVPMTGHKYRETVLKNPTCSSKGSVKKSCTVCGSTFTGTIAKRPHEYVNEGGITRCKVCGKRAYSVVVPEQKPENQKPVNPDAETRPQQDAVNKPQEAEAAPTNPKDNSSVVIADTRTSSEKARQAAVEWAIEIANDNSFHYGRSSWAHHNGCYFCGTNQKAGSIKRKKGASVAACEKTYCCNPFVTAAYMHGAGAKEVDCRKGNMRFGLANDKNIVLKNTKAFKKISKPAKVTALEAGDILLTPTHAMLYAGDGKVVEAAHHDNGKKDAYWNDSIRHKEISSKQWNRVTKIYRYIGKGKF